MLRCTIIILAVLALIGAAINVAFAVTRLPPRKQRLPAFSTVTGAQAAATPYPVRTPHVQPWPPPTQVELSGRFGVRVVHTWSTNQNNENTHSMEAKLLGWPLPVVEVVQFWWPWSDPAWTTTAPSDPSPRLKLSGLIINPLLFALALWLLLVAPFEAFRLARRQIRYWKKECLACGYPVGVADQCTECGAALPAGLAASPPPLAPA